MDRVSKTVRSKMMSCIRGKNTKPELILFEELDKKGILYQEHYKILGNPDIVFPDINLAVFVDGTFWHGYDYEIRKKTLPEYWVNKIKRNMKRDKKYTQKLKTDGWKVIRFWEHKVLKDPRGCVEKLIKILERNHQKDYFV